MPAAGDVAQPPKASLSTNTSTVTSKTAPRKELPPSSRPAKSPPGGPSQQKKISRRSSKPILHWLQRKLGGTARTRRPVIESAPPHQGNGKERSNRVASNPVHPVNGQQDTNRRPSVKTDVQRKTISLNGDEDGLYSDSASADSSSAARESTWSPASALEADEDASVRPLPPSSPPSPSPSHSSSSYLSNPRTFRSMAASTKPTTLLSIDLNGNGMAHIAQAPLTPVTQHRPTHARTSSTASNNLLSSGTSITFSALPPPSPTSPADLSPPSSATVTTPHGDSVPLNSVQAPQHTTHHPRNNPRPSSPPNDDASVLTLASSAFAIHGWRGGGATSSIAPSALGAGSDSMSHFGGSTHFTDAESTSQFVGDDTLEGRDVDASVRALRPRSSRRGSWESEASRWSARIQSGAGTPSLTRERSLWTSNSVRTGTFSSENAEVYDKAEDSTVDTGSTTGVPEGLSAESEKRASSSSRPPAIEIKDSEETEKGQSELEPTPKNADKQIENKVKAEDQTTPKEELNAPLGATIEKTEK